MLLLPLASAGLYTLDCIYLMDCGYGHFFDKSQMGRLIEVCKQDSLYVLVVYLHSRYKGLFLMNKCGLDKGTVSVE